MISIRARVSAHTSAMTLARPPVESFTLEPEFGIALGCSPGFAMRCCVRSGWRPGAVRWRWYLM
jgi:hypothetical protein